MQPWELSGVFPVFPQHCELSGIVNLYTSGYVVQSSQMLSTKQNV